MIDIHAHILPFIDDGSDSLEKSLEMLKSEANIGVTDVICTPHYRNIYKKRKDEIIDIFEDFKAQADKAQIPIKLHLGQEIYVSQTDIKAMLKNGSLLTLNQSRWVLVEFDFARRAEIAETVYEIRNSGYVPIVAHIERYFYATEDEAYEIKQNGGFIQVNAGSILGRAGGKIKKFSRNLFKNGLVDFVASDIHSGRENVLDKAYAFVKKKYGDAAAYVTFEHNAKKILKG